MGETTTITEFVTSCDNQYLAKNLSPGLRASVEITESDALCMVARKHIVERRRESCLDKETARDLWEMSDGFSGCDQMTDDDKDLMYRIFGNEWWYDLPTEPNPDYEYLCRIIGVIRLCLNSRMGEVTA